MSKSTRARIAESYKKRLREVSFPEETTATAELTRNLFQFDPTHPGLSNDENDRRNVSARKALNATIENFFSQDVDLRIYIDAVESTYNGSPSTLMTLDHVFFANGKEIIEGRMFLQVTSTQIYVQTVSGVFENQAFQRVMNKNLGMSFATGLAEAKKKSLKESKYKGKCDGNNVEVHYFYDDNTSNCVASGVAEQMIKSGQAFTEGNRIMMKPRFRKSASEKPQGSGESDAEVKKRIAKIREEYENFKNNLVNQVRRHGDNYDEIAKQVFDFKRYRGHFGALADHEYIRSADDFKKHLSYMPNTQVYDKLKALFKRYHG